MCGIAGWFNLEGKGNNSRESLIDMLKQISHRGPDSIGAYIHDRVYMGNVRLSIIDVTGGTQPISNEDGSIWVVYNGEIYNYRELREKLIARGHKFKTLSDTEVLVHLYEEYGRDLTTHIDGNFAFAIIDHRNDTFLLGRDRFGIRPLYYTVKNKRIYFASEIKALFAINEIDREFDKVGLNQVVTLWGATAPRTVFKNINQLQAGFTLQVRDSNFHTEQYWSIPFKKACDPVIKDTNEAIELVQFELDQAVKRRLVSDVPVGVYLSGGIDSTIISHLVRQNYSGDLNSYSIGFEDSQYDERNYQSLIQKQLGTNHHSVTCSYEDITNVMPEVIEHAETPLVRSAPAPMYLLSKLVQGNNGKVVLTGEGADEAFGGYDIFREAKIRQFWSRFPQSKIRPLLLKKIYGYLPHFQGENYRFQVAFFSRYLSNNQSDDFSHQVRWGINHSLQSFFNDDWKMLDKPEKILLQTLPDSFHSASVFEKARYLECKTLLESYLLSSQGDRMTLGNGVEGRFPFLDHNLWEAITQLDDSLLIKGVSEKWILKKSYADYLPESIVKRAKQPYLAPNIKAYFMQDKVPGYVEELLNSKRLSEAGYFNVEMVERLMMKIKKNPEKASYKDDSAFLFILTTMLLDETFIKNKPRNSKVDIPIHWVKGTS